MSRKAADAFIKQVLSDYQTEDTHGLFSAPADDNPLSPYVDLGCKLIALIGPEEKGSKKFPISDKDRGKKRKFKAANKKANFTPEQLQEWLYKGEGNVGAELGDGVVVVDVDLRRCEWDDEDPEASMEALVDGRACWQWLEQNLPLDEAPVVRTGSGLHFFFGVPLGSRFSKRRMPKQGTFMVDLKSAGAKSDGTFAPSYVVCAGSQHRNKQYYQWVRKPKGPLPQIDIKMLGGLELGEVDERHGPSPLPSGVTLSDETIEGILQQWPASQFKDYTKWLTMLGMCYRASGGSTRVLQALQKWSESDPDHGGNGAQACEDKWSNGGLGDPEYAHLDGSVLVRRAAKQGVRLPGEFARLLDKMDQGFDTIQYESNEQKLEEEVDLMIEKLNLRYAKITIGSDFRIIKQDLRNGDTRNTLNEHAFMRLDEALRMVDVVGDDGEIKRKKLGNIWINSRAARSYEEEVFDPTGAEIASREHPKKVLNTFRGYRNWDMKRAKKPVHLLKLIKEVLAGDDEASYKFILDWCAHVIQRPGHKTGVVLVLSGGEGVGKSLFADVIFKLTDPYSCTDSGGSKLFGKFNSHLEQTLFYKMDEFEWIQNSRGRVNMDEGMFKSLVTDTHMAIEQKGVSVKKRGRNYLNFMITTNHPRPVPITSKSRRYSLFRTSDDALPVGDQERQDFFDSIGEEVGRETGGDGNGGLEWMYNFLSKRKLPNMHLQRCIPHTPAMQDALSESMSMEQEWWRECLLGNTLFPGQNNAADPGLANETPGFGDNVSINLLANSLNSWLQSTGNRHMRDRQPRYFSRKFTDWTGLEKKEGPRGTDNLRTLFIPVKDKCEEAFEAQFGVKHDYSFPTKLAIVKDTEEDKFEAVDNPGDTPI